MNKEDLITSLKKLTETHDIESGHITADMLLIAYINDEEISEAYASVPKWYA